MTFQDHFSKQASAYAAYRPQSPPELFRYLAELTHPKDLAWDVGTGNGQAAVSLTEYFKSVVATDASAKQIEQAEQHPKITYRIAAAEEPVLSPHSVNLITAAQAIHWFDLDKFYAEVRRIAAPHAILAAWSYELPTVTPEVDAICYPYCREEIGKYWPKEIKWVGDQYKTLPFPFDNIPSPHFRITLNLNLERWCGYIFTWSATQRAIADKGPPIFDSFVRRTTEIWGDPEKTKAVTWPLFLRVGRI